MEHVYEGQAVAASPYVTQADRFAASLHHMADRFLKMEPPKKQLSEYEVKELAKRVEEKVCAKCERHGACEKEDAEGGRIVDALVHEILCTVEDYGAELNIELKRKLQGACCFAPRFARETMEAFQEVKKRMVWDRKIAQSREGCAVQLDQFASVVQHATRELEASIFTDPPLEKKIRMRLKRAGVRLLSSVFFVTPEGRYEIHVTVKAEKGTCVATRTVADLLSACVGRRMCPARDERPVVSQEYCTIAYVEGPSFYTMQGIAKIGKGCERISGDSFLMTQLPGGMEAAILSDGMGSGEDALRESSMVVEMLEELLKAGFPRETALAMLNTALVMGREEVFFSTMDISIFDLYTGGCEILKAGAAQTFIRRAEGKMEHISSDTLPLGVVWQQDFQKEKIRLGSGDMVVMVTDGVLDGLPAGEQESLLDLIICGSSQENPKELAHDILQKVLELGDGTPSDDMTVLVAGLWNL